MTVCCTRALAPTAAPEESTSSTISTKRLPVSNYTNTLAQYAEFPWVVYVLTYGNKTGAASVGNEFVCGGTLIHPRFVVSTAHNTDDKTDLVARFGDWDISTTNEPHPHQEITIEEIMKHPLYRLIPIQNDIALLRLTDNVKCDVHIRPISLPQVGVDFVGKQCIANGWSNGTDALTNVMKKISLLVIGRHNCTRMLGSAGLGPFFKLSAGFLCAGGEGNDICEGDGGSPLACQTEGGSYVLAGIVTWGMRNCGPYLPGVYVAVNHYVEWINEHLGNVDQVNVDKKL